MRRAIVKIIPELATKQIVKTDTSLEILSDYLIKQVNTKELRTDSIEALAHVAIELGPQFNFFLKKLAALYNTEIKKKPLYTGLFNLLRGIVLVGGPGMMKLVDLEAFVTTLMPTVDFNI